MSNPDEPPGEAARSTRVTWPRCGPGWPSWSRSPPGSGCAGSGPRRSTTPRTTCPSSVPLPAFAGVTVASAGGAGMMWGPGVAKAAADVALTGSSDVLDVSPLGLDRFDENGHSRLATDPIALPFPERISSSLRSWNIALWAAAAARCRAWPGHHDVRHRDRRGWRTQQLDRFVEAGGTLVDTADVYSHGVGTDHRPLVRQPPGRRHRAGGAGHQGPLRSGDDAPNGAGLSARHLTRALDASLGGSGSIRSTCTRSTPSTR
jgi:hypothetical protein